tara:strand:+ start:352 stop:606 length:255 start_codon:yes stop_codon:yes gene_type:complete
MNNKLKNVWKQSKTKDYTTIEPTQFTSYARNLKWRNPSTESIDLKQINKELGVSTNYYIGGFQKKFTKKGKKAVEDLKLKSLKK